jgi:membrane protein YdbS with pleckstrin-like domain
MYQRYDTAFMQVFTILFGNFDLTEFYASPSPKYAVVALLAVFLFVVICCLIESVDCDDGRHSTRH